MFISVEAFLVPDDADGEAILVSRLLVKTQLNSK